jgi:hypothetical protein
MSGASLHTKIKKKNLFGSLHSSMLLLEHSNSNPKDHLLFSSSYLSGPNPNVDSQQMSKLKGGFLRAWVYISCFDSLFHTGDEWAVELGHLGETMEKEEQLGAAGERDEREEDSCGVKRK